MLQLPRTFRVLFVCAATLVAAGLAVVAARLTPGDDSLPAAVTEVAVQETIVREVAIITTADGRQIAVDPSTPEGKAAIADAVARGDVVRTTTVTIAVPPSRDRSPDGAAAADAQRAELRTAPLSPAVLGAVLEEVASGGAGLPPAPTPDGGDDGGSPIDDLTRTADSVVDDVTDVVDDVVDDVTDLVDDVTDEVIDVVDDVTDGTTVSVPGVPVTVTTPPVTVPPVTVTVPPVTVTVTVPPPVTTIVTLPPVTVTVTVPLTVPLTVPPTTVPPTTVPTIPGFGH